ncbi:hypothetical protein Fmac_014857 [Flemingia macrophylla]|uniref:DUF7135 domain-containing protein n=1 Tax=Flemingia macrophylla TaxID=520843 RepID=A0ABD1MCZ0_9FABA
MLFSGHHTRNSNYRFDIACDKSSVDASRRHWSQDVVSTINMDKSLWSLMDHLFTVMITSGALLMDLRHILWDEQSTGLQWQLLQVITVSYLWPPGSGRGWWKLTAPTSILFRGNTPNAKWILSNKHTTYSFVKDFENNRKDDVWFLTVGSKFRIRALKFPSDNSYHYFVTDFQNRVFKNMYDLECTEENKVKIYGKEFIDWVKLEVAHDSVWEDAVSAKAFPSPGRWRNDLMERGTSQFLHLPFCHQGMFHHV